MPVHWGEPWAEWQTPEFILDGWRQRIARLADRETAYFADLPYVRGVAAIGTVPRGTVWPLSDVDVLTVVDTSQAEDPAARIRAEETQRNHRLRDARIPNEVETRYWVLLTDDVLAANASEDAFFELVTRPYRWGVVFKAHGGRAVKDFDGQLRRFLDTCQRVAFGERFLRFRLDARIAQVSHALEAAHDSAERGQCTVANARALVAAHDMTTELYLTWTKLPESLTRSVTRLLSAAADAGEPETGELFLTATGLTREEAWRRFAATPSWAAHERDVLLAVRHGIGEEIDELEATRDLLHVSSYLALRGVDAGPYPEWISATNTQETATARLQAAERLLKRLQQARAQLRNSR